MNKGSVILDFLREQPGYISGAHMASSLHISRTAIWKHLKQLEEMGYRFEKLKGRGYHLTEVPDRLYPGELERHLHTRSIGREIVYRDSAESTNVLAFKLALAGCAEGTCVIAETQTAGRGRLQRKWYSPYAKNLYLSVVLRPEMQPAQVYPLTFISSLAVYDTLKIIGLQPRLKWPNDVLVNRKKISGTLIELSTEADVVRFVVMGIGLNINMDEAELDAEIKDKATSLFMETKNHFERVRICGMLLDALETYYDLIRQQGAGEICRAWEERAKTKGTYMEITQMDRVYRGISEGIDTDGAILLNQNGTLTRVIAGDVTA